MSGIHDLGWPSYCQVAAFLLGVCWPGLLLAQAAERLPDATCLGGRQAESDTVGTAPACHDAVVALVGPRGFSCSGVLVHRRAVLTARHCSDIRYAVFGSAVEQLLARRSVVARRTPPGPAADLALLILDAPAPVEPYAIAYPQTPPAEVRIVGFGCTDPDCRSGAGKRTAFDAALRPNDWGCVRPESARVGCDPLEDLVVARAEAADTCVGDSGGGVLVREGSSWAVLAITSRSVSDSILRCGDGGIYTRLVRHASWLNGELGPL